jgi:hypothetical protein
MQLVRDRRMVFSWIIPCSFVEVLSNRRPSEIYMFTMPRAYDGNDAWV